jgi:predicted nucleic acid-binding protein
VSDREAPPLLVLDTSVAVKFYLSESLIEEAGQLRTAVDDEELELIAPSTIQPEFWNALWQQHRRGGLSLEEVRDTWREFAKDPISLYKPEDLMPRAAEIAASSGAIIYDALFLALAEYTASIVVTVDNKLLKTLEETPFAERARYLGEVRGLL